MSVGYIFVAIIFCLAVFTFAYECIQKVISKSRPGVRTGHGALNPTSRDKGKEKIEDDETTEIKSDSQTIKRRKIHKTLENDNDKLRSESISAQQEKYSTLAQEQKKRELEKKEKEEEMIRQINIEVARSQENERARRSNIRNSQPDSLLIDRTSSTHTQISHKLLQDRALKEQQDEEFQRALEEDLKYEHELKKKRDEEEKARLEEIRIQEEKERKIQNKITRFEHLKRDFDLKKSNEIVKLRIRLPGGGDVIENQFGIGEKLQTVFWWIESKQPTIDIEDGKHVLVSNIPRFVYGDGEKSLEELGLKGPVQLFVEEK